MTPQEKRDSIQALRARIGQILVEKTPRKGFTKKQRQQVSEAYDGLCAGCDEPLLPGFHIDHIKALADGGEHALSNWRAMCPSCHIQKSRVETTARAKTERIRKVETVGREPSRLKSRNEWPRSQGFNTRLKRKMDGRVVEK